MKMKNKAYTALRRGLLGCSMTAAIALLTACGDFLEEYSQDTDYVRTWKDLDELLIGDCYMPVNGSGEFYRQANYGQFIHLLADEVEEQRSGYTIVFDSHEYSFGYYTWQQRVGQNESYSGFNVENTLWTKVYKQINIANNVLRSVEKVPQNNETDKQGALKVKGEAHFLRGWYYFFLVNLYGPAYDPATATTDLGVPVKVSEEVNDVKFQRQSVQEVYEQVLSDLLAAEEELGQVTTSRRSIYRADVTAVRLLLSRVYLYMQNWEKAAAYARQVTKDHPQLQNLNVNNDRIMQKSNVENIFSMGGDDVCCMIDYASKGLRLSTDLYNAYNSVDLRRSQWIWKYADFQGPTLREYVNTASPEATPNEARYWFYTSSNALSSSQAQVSSLFWLRSAEAWLNLAEAEAYLRHDEEAQTALNTLRAARINEAYTQTAHVDATGDDLIKAIRLERRLEFMLQGQRWFDLRRYRVNTVLPEKKRITHDYTYYVERNSTTATERHRFVLTEDDPSWTLPIPNEVLEFNTGMPNNNNQWREFTVVPLN